MPLDLVFYTYPYSLHHSYTLIRSYTHTLTLSYTHTLIHSTHSFPTPSLLYSTRAFSVGTSSIGLGSKDFCITAFGEGISWTKLLPMAMGEAAPAKQMHLDKLARAKNRKAATLAALEREKMRRNMTDAEKEEIRRQEEARRLETWAEEEGMLCYTPYTP